MNKSLILLAVVLLGGCDYPPDGALAIQEKLQGSISKGQVYLMHASETVSLVIKNSEYNSRPAAEQDELISRVGQETLEMLARNDGFDTVKIYFVGDGAAGINQPYLCRQKLNGCVRQAPN